MNACAPLPLAILISGRGSNMAAIAAACASGALKARITLVISERADAAGLPIARSLGLNTLSLPWQGAAGRSEFESAVEAALASDPPQLIALAGFMRILSTEFVDRHRERLINIHPALLPKYRGLNTHRRALAAGEAFHGASVHYVTPELDGGPVVLQSRLKVRAGETEQALAARVLATEHVIYPRAIGWIADGRLGLRDGQPWLDGRPLPAPLVEDFDG